MVTFNTFRPGISKIFLSLMLCAFFHLSIFAQVDKDISQKKKKDRAKYAMQTGNVYTALFYYEDITKNDPKDTESRFQLAEAYRLARNYKMAAESYGIVYDKAPTSYPTALYYKGLMLKMQGKYEDAKKCLVDFKKILKDLNDKNLNKLITKEIAGCDSGMVYRDFPENTDLQNAGKSVNQPHTEFSPFLLDSMNMLFGTLREDSLRYYEVESEHPDKQPMRQIHKAEKINGQWKDKGLFDILNDPNVDMGNFVYSPYTDRYYFSKCFKNEKGKVTCKLYIKEREKAKGAWKDAAELPFPVNMEGYTSTQPTVVYDTVTKRELLYFVSDRAEGKGGLDIWYTSYNAKKQEWAEPKNGGIMNTTETECTPFYHIPSQTFYFSSDGHGSAGGLDVYKTYKDKDGRYVKPQNLSFPINSPQDDLHFMLEKSGKNGVVVSNRPGGTPFFHETCCDDIFTFHINEAKPFNCTLEIAIADPDTARNKSRLLKVTSIDMKTKQEKKDTIRLKDNKFVLPLTKNHQYTFRIDQDGYQKDSLVVETREMASSDIIKRELSLRPVEVEIIAEKPVEDKPFVLKDVTYGSDEFTLNEDAKAALDSLLIPFLKLHPKDKITIGSHTDDQGAHKYNINLSQKRADNVVKYLISKGIEASRITAKGYGETKPIAPNQNNDGTDNAIGRAINRRTEFLLEKAK